jgi:solute carrier family 25 folate transporter 32
MISTQFKYTSIFLGLKSMISKEGPMSLYKGFVPSLFGITHVAIQFPLYEKLKLCSKDEIPSSKHLLFSSAASKLAAVVATYPHEVLLLHTGVTDETANSNAQGGICFVRQILWNFKIRFYNYIRRGHSWPL